MEEKTWTVVQFVDDGTVEAVPSTWIQGHSCHWPSFAPQKMQGAIRKSEPLNTCWPAHPVKIFRNATFDDYTKARAKSRLAEETSDLNTDNTDRENEPRKKRRIIQKVLSSSDESIEDCESILEMPPNISKYRQPLGKSLLLSKGNELEIENKNLDKDVSSRVSSIACSSKDVAPEFQDPKPAAVISNLDGKVCKNCIGVKDKQMKTLIEQNHVLRGLITEVLEKVGDIKKVVQRGTVENKVNKSLFKNHEISFPIENDEDFEKLESLLENEEDFLSATQELSKIGGSNTYDHVKRVLQLIITNNHALKYSWQGMKGNRKFKETNLAKLLLKSTEAAGLADSHKTTESAVQTWLRRASDRRITEGKRVQKKF